MNWPNIVERMVEEADAKNERELDKLIDAPESYAYAMKERGVSRGYFEKFFKTFPDADFNYIFTGKRTKMPDNPRVAVEILLKRITEDPTFSRELTQEYDKAVSDVKDHLPRDQYFEEILRLVLRLISISLENK